MLYLVLAVLLAAAVWSAGQYLERRPAMYARAGAFALVALIVWWRPASPDWPAGVVLVALAALGVIEAARACVVFWHGRP